MNSPYSQEFSSNSESPVYLSPAVIDIVTMAQGIYEQKICGAAMVSRGEVLRIVGSFKPEINRAACKFWPILLKNADLGDSLKEAWNMGLGLDTIVFSEMAAMYSNSVELAHDSLHRWKCCKAARLGLQAIASDATIGEIIEKSRYGRG